MSSSLNSLSWPSLPPVPQRRFLRARVSFAGSCSGVRNPPLLLSKASGPWPAVASWATRPVLTQCSWESPGCRCLQQLGCGSQLPGLFIWPRPVEVGKLPKDLLFQLLWEHQGSEPLNLEDAGVLTRVYGWLLGLKIPHNHGYSFFFMGTVLCMYTCTHVHLPGQSVHSFPQILKSLWPLGFKNHWSGKSLKC